MATLFIIVIYLAFISLGLPDSILGASWTVLQHDINASFETAGILSMTVSAGTIISSLLSERLIKKFGTGKVTFLSVLATALALLGTAFTPSFFFLLVLAIPLGLGAGSVDAALNNYVALHYKPHHMSWLHCFWGVGATIGPMIMAGFLQKNNNWRSGYLTISIIQFILVLILFITLPMWDKISANSDANQVNLNINDERNSNLPVFKIKGVTMALLTFLFYCGIESSVGLWGSSYLVHIKDMTPATAARWVSMFYAGITIGRFITGFITMKLSSKQLIRYGQMILFVGILLLLLPGNAVYSLIAFILIGLGCAPIYPCMIHETPTRFGKTQSQKIIGLQMACAYTGSTFLPPILGFATSRTSLLILPVFLLVYIIAMLFCSERINVLMKHSI